MCVVCTVFALWWMLFKLTSILIVQTWMNSSADIRTALRMSYEYQRCYSYRSVWISALIFVRHYVCRMNISVAIHTGLYEYHRPKIKCVCKLYNIVVFRRNVLQIKKLKIFSKNVKVNQGIRLYFVVLWSCTNKSASASDRFWSIKFASDRSGLPLAPAHP